MPEMTSLNVENLFYIFNSLEIPPGGFQMPSFSAMPVNDSKMNFIAKSSNGDPVLLIALMDTSMISNIVPPITLEHLVVDHGVRCKIHHKNGVTQEMIFSVIRCVNADKLLQQYFFHSLIPIVSYLPQRPTASDISKMINVLADLFYRLSQLGIKSIQGIWAELFLIVWSRHPEVLIEAWHPHPNDKYDFAYGRERVEVKSSSSGLRVHHFSFEQLNPPDEIQVVIASIFVEEVSNGHSVFDLVENIRLKIRQDSMLTMKIDKIVSTAIGNDWRRANELRFDFERAKSSLFFYNPHSVPTVLSPLPSEVTLVHFQSDLSFSTPIKLDTMDNKGILFSSLKD